MLDGKDPISPNLPAASKVGEMPKLSDNDDRAMDVSFVDNDNRSQSPTATFTEPEQESDEAVDLDYAAIPKALAAFGEPLWYITISCSTNSMPNVQITYLLPTTGPRRQSRTRCLLSSCPKFTLSPRPTLSSLPVSKSEFSQAGTVITCLFSHVLTKKLRLAFSSNQPPFQNGFKLWGDAVIYYMNNFNNSNIHIIKARSSTNLNPIVVPLTAPTPHKPRQCVEFKGRGPLKKKGVASDQPTALGSTLPVASGSVPAVITAPGSTQLVLKSNKKGKQSTTRCTLLSPTEYRWSVREY